MIGFYQLLVNPTSLLIEPPGTSILSKTVARPYMSLILFIQTISNWIVYTLQALQQYYYGIL